MKSDIQQTDNSLIFINYRRADAGWPADHLADKLKSVFGNDRVFLDVRGIKAGDDFAEELRSKMQRATVLIVLIGHKWLYVHDQYGRRRLDQENDWVRREIRIALENKNCKVIPVLLDDAQLPTDSDALPKDISQILLRQRIRIRQTNSDDDIIKLIEILKEFGFQSTPKSSTGFVQESGNVIMLTKPKQEVSAKLLDQIDRGRILLGQLQKRSKSEWEDLNQLSSYWHRWRNSSENILTDSFSSSEPFNWLKALSPTHLEFGKPKHYLGKKLHEDISKELAFLENLVIRLDNYDELF